MEKKDDLFGRMAGALGRVRDAVVRSSQIGKIKLDSTFLRKDRERLVLELGEEALNLMLVDRLPVPEELSGLVRRIRETEGRIEAESRQVDAILREGLDAAR